MKITLNEAKDEATIQADPDEVVDKETVVLKVGEVIDYKPAGEDCTRSGMIQRFWDLGDGSIWAQMKEATGEAFCPTEAISLLNWKNYLDAGAIRN